MSLYSPIIFLSDMPKVGGWTQLPHELLQNLQIESNELIIKDASVFVKVLSNVLPKHHLISAQLAPKITRLINGNEETIIHQEFTVDAHNRCVVQLSANAQSTNNVNSLSADAKHFCAETLMDDPNMCEKNARLIGCQFGQLIADVQSINTACQPIASARLTNIISQPVANVQLVASDDHHIAHVKPIVASTNVDVIDLQYIPLMYFPAQSSNIYIAKKIRSNWPKIKQIIDTDDKYAKKPHLDNVYQKSSRNERYNSNQNSATTRDNRNISIDIIDINDE